MSLVSSRQNGARIGRTAPGQECAPPSACSRSGSSQSTSSRRPSTAPSPVTPFPAYVVDKGKESVGDLMGGGLSTSIIDHRPSIDPIAGAHRHPCEDAFMSCSRLFHSNIAHDDQGNLYRTWEKRPATADSSPKTNRSRYAGRLAADCSAASHKRAADRADQLENNIWGNVDNLIESQGPVQQRDSNPDASVVAHNASVTGCHRSYTLRQMLRQPMPGATQKGGASRSAKQADYVVDNITAHDHRPPVEAIGGLGGASTHAGATEWLSAMVAEKRHLAASGFDGRGAKRVCWSFEEEGLHIQSLRSAMQPALGAGVSTDRRLGHPPTSPSKSKGVH